MKSTSNSVINDHVYEDKVVYITRVKEGFIKGGGAKLLTKVFLFLFLFEVNIPYFIEDHGGYELGGASQFYYI